MSSAIFRFVVEVRPDWRVARRQKRRAAAFAPANGRPRLADQAPRRTSRTGRRHGLRAPRGPRVTFFFDLVSPWTYLAAERAERLFAAGRWRPAIDDPEVIAEAAAAAGLALDDALAAAGQLRRDGPMERAALRLLRRGADELPAVTVGRQLFAGESRLAEAAAAAAAPPALRRRAARPG